MSNSVFQQGVATPCFLAIARSKKYDTTIWLLNINNIHHDKTH
jgi:hypothetical protein